MCATVICHGNHVGGWYVYTELLVFPYPSVRVMRLLRRYADEMWFVVHYAKPCNCLEVGFPLHVGPY